jgi:membrane associated rhomboid family serine protease
MIVPCPVNFWELKRYPLTWGLVGINIFIFLVFFLGANEQSNWDSFFSESNLRLTGRIYHEYILKPETDTKNLPPWITTMTPTTETHFQSLAAWALRDSTFLEVSDDIKVSGDDVAIKLWKDGIYKFKNSYYEQMVFKLGLSRMNKDSLAWITYQFSHSGFIHLLSNMIYLVIIGTAVEAMIGSFGLVLLYFVGGIFAGMMFLFIKSHGGAIPMIGASGSISALMAFYILFEARRNIRYVYLISLHPRHNGYIYLPTLWMIPLFVISDFANHFSSVEGLGAGVAYSAHMGGTLFGASLALVCKYVFKTQNSLVYGEFFPPQEPVAEPIVEYFEDDDF